MGKILDDSELDMFDSINADLVELAGTEVNFYAYDPTSKENKKDIDPLYGEPTERKILGPFRLHAIIKYPEHEPTVGEEGFGREWDGEAVFSRWHLDKAHAPYPSEGDIVELWRTPFHDQWSLGKGMYFDVIRVKPDGHLNGMPAFTQFRCTLKRRSQYAPERKIKKEQGGNAP